MAPRIIKSVYRGFIVKKIITVSIDETTTFAIAKRKAEKIRACTG